MTAARLEELARRCQVEHDEFAESRETFFDYGDLLLLARCARAWAKVEAAGNPSLERWNWPQGAKWYFRPGGRTAGSGPTAIEAVEAAEAKP